MSDTQCMAVIFLLYKKGDSNLLSNYRPISLTNADYKILAYVLSHWLADHLTDVIAVNQTAYMSGWFIGTNIRFVQDTISFFAKSSPCSVILFLDYTKAFDSVSHQFIFCLLDKMGFPCDYIKWVQIIYTSAVSSVRYNNWLTSPIALQQGVRQGCPLSCHLFNLVGQVLMYHMCDQGLFNCWSKWGDPCSLYADDTIIFLEKESDLSITIDTIFLVGNYTGLHLNSLKQLPLLHKGVIIR